MLYKNESIRKIYSADLKQLIAGLVIGALGVLLMVCGIALLAGLIMIFMNGGRLIRSGKITSISNITAAELDKEACEGSSWFGSLIYATTSFLAGFVCKPDAFNSSQTAFRYEGIHTEEFGVELIPAEKL